MMQQVQPMMQQSNNMTWLPIAAVAAAVMLGMFMGRRSKKSSAGAGWWTGLIILLVVMSLMFSYTSLRIGGHKEERFATRSENRNQAWEADLAEAQEQVSQAMRQVQRAPEAAAREVRDALRGTLGGENSATKPKNKSGGRSFVSISPPATPLPPLMKELPNVPVEWPIVVDEKNRSKSEEVVKEIILQNSLAKIREWIKLQMPIRDEHIRLDQSYLKEKEFFPEGIHPQLVKVSLPDGKKEEMYEASAKLVLSPELQKKILMDELANLMATMQRELLEKQSVLLGVILCITAGAALLGGYRMYRRWVQLRFTPTPAPIS